LSCLQFDQHQRQSQASHLNNVALMFALFEKCRAMLRLSGIALIENGFSGFRRWQG
jgi:hypothetical protein